MPTLRIEISPKIIKEAKEAAASGEHTSSQPLIFADVVEKGLQLRVQQYSVSWLLKFKNYTKSLGTISEIQNITLARKTAQKVRNLLKEDLDVKSFLNAKANENTDEQALEKSALATKKKAGEWTWLQLTEEYFEYLSKPRRGRPASEKSAKNARNSIDIKEAEYLNDKLLSEISAADFENIRDITEKAGRKTASRAFLANAKAALSFAKKMHSAKSGLSNINRWWLEVQQLDSTYIAAKTRAPTLQEIVRILHTIEQNRILKKEKNQAYDSINMLSGIWFLILSAQRISASFSLKKVNIKDHNDAELRKKGWKIAYWSAEDMKSKRLHALPLPPKFALLFDRINNVGSEYVFSSSTDSDKHLDINSPKNMFSRLRKSGKLDDVDHFTPHDFRRSFATWCSDNLLPDGAASAVLDHAITGETVISADITRQIYDRSQRLNLKAIALEKWSEAIFDEYRKTYNVYNPFAKAKEELWFDKPVFIEENRLILVSDHM